MSQPKPPAPNPSKDLKKSTQVYLKFLPQLLQAEQSARTQYDPQRIQEQQQLQQQYGPKQYQEQLDALHQLDPESTTIRAQMARRVSGDLASGYAIPPELQTYLDSIAGGTAVKYGNVAGSAPAIAEEALKGKTAIDLYQQHLQNAGNFLGLQTPEQAIGLIQPVTPDRASAYVNPSAPAQAAQNSYQNMLAQYQLSRGTGGGFAGSLSGAIGGATAGASIGGGNPYAIAGGAIVGGVGGYFFSDERMKENIVPAGFSPKGYPIYEFNYKEVPHQRFRGTIAQHILPLKPSAVTMDQTGMWRVDYDQLDIKLEQIPEEALV